MRSGDSIPDSAANLGIFSNLLRIKQVLVFSLEGNVDCGARANGILLAKYGKSFVMNPAQL